MAEQRGKVLITGGAGYIGSHAVLAMKQQGNWDPVVVDNFSRGNRDLADTLGAPLCAGDLRNDVFLDEVFASHKPVAVMHFAAFAYVGESTEDPERYYVNNLVGTLKLLEVMRRHQVRTLIFSSTCATYGEPTELPIDERCVQRPVNPYGRGKLMVEEILRDYDSAYGLKTICFRYFNAAGADPDLRLGERHDPETHLIPLAIKAAISGKPVRIFGNDYPTRDGTCVRDYIHVLDIAQAHLLGLEALLRTHTSTAYNIGNGSGYSVLEVLEAVERISGKKVPHEFAPRRAGDPPALVASAAKLRQELGWQPQFPRLDDMVSTAWKWEVKDSCYRESGSLRSTG